VPERWTHWVATVSLDHVTAAAGGGFTQADHGASTRLSLLRPGDRIVYYSPRTALRGGRPVRRFTALATVTGEAPYQVEVSDTFRPWRLDVTFHECRPVDAVELVEHLSFVRDPAHWGLPFRRGLFGVPPADFDTIAAGMRWKKSVLTVC